MGLNPIFIILILDYQSITNSYKTTSRFRSHSYSFIFFSRGISLLKESKIIVEAIQSFHQQWFMYGAILPPLHWNDWFSFLFHFSPPSRPVHFLKYDLLYSMNLRIKRGYATIFIDTFSSTFIIFISREYSNCLSNFLTEVY